MNTVRHCATNVSRLTSMIIALTIVAVLGFFEPAQATQKSFTFCNRIAEPVDLAVGYDRAGTSETTSEGWHKLAPCSCREIFNHDLRATEIFILVVKKDQFNVLTGGKGPLCVTHPKGFRFINQNKSEATCKSAGGRWVAFQFQDITQNETFEFRLSGAKQCNL